MISERSCPACKCCFFYSCTPAPVSFNFTCIGFLSLSLLYDFWKCSPMASSNLIKSPPLLTLILSSPTGFLFHSWYCSYLEFPFDSAFYQVILASYLLYYFTTFGGCLSFFLFCLLLAFLVNLFLFKVNLVARIPAWFSRELRFPWGYRVKWQVKYTRRKSQVSALIWATLAGDG